MKRPALLAILAMAGMAGCGAEDERLVAPEPNSARVALTVDYPGTAPMALITYRADGRRCHALGTLTAVGPRLMSNLATPLEEALAREGRCLDARHPLVSLNVREPGAPPLRVVAGIVRADVVRVVVAGQRVRPHRGAFLVAHPAGTGTLGTVVQVELRDGRRRRLPLSAAAS